MKSLTRLSVGLCFASLSLIMACEDQFKLVPDPDEVIEVPGFNGEGIISPSRINDLNQIIGYYGTGWPVGITDFYEDQDVTGFLINSDGSGFMGLRQPDHQNNWPFDINNEGQIVGAYMPFGQYSGTYTPAYAYVMNTDGTGFQELHPEGSFYSIARRVTSSGLVFGEHGPDGVNSVACMFKDGEVIDLVDTSEIDYSKISSANDEVVIVYGTEDEIWHFWKYDIANETLTKLPIAENITDFAGLLGINDRGIAAGFSVDLSVDAQSQAVVFDTNNDELLTYRDFNQQRTWAYLEYKIFDINNSGTMVGWSSRDIGGGSPQARAFRMNQDFTGFRDVTPENGDIYSELVSINESGLALGLIGLPRRDLAVHNKIFVIQVD